MTSLRTRTTFHVLAMVHHVFAIWVSNVIFTSEHKHPDVANLIYSGPVALTHWNMAFQSTFLVLSLVRDYLEMNGRANAICDRLRCLVFHGLVFPFTIYITGCFWTLWSVDRELVFPAVMDTAVPSWLNQSVHSLTMVVLILEVLLDCPREVEREEFRRLMMAATYAYAMVYQIYYFATGVSVYQLYVYMNWPLRILWLIKYIGTVHFLYAIQWPLYNFLLFK